jgi:hypothetical protein
MPVGSEDKGVTKKFMKPFYGFNGRVGVASQSKIKYPASICGFYPPRASRI